MPDIIVKNQTELDAAIKAAKGGETIKLAAGTYTGVSVVNKNFTSNVTITSLDPKAKVNVTKFAVTGSSNVTLKDIDAKVSVMATTEDAKVNVVYSSSNVVLDGMGISGGTGDPSASLGYGIHVRNNTGFTIKNSSIDHYTVGMLVQNVDDMKVLNNSFLNNRRDHTNFTEMSNLVIDGNSFTNLFPVGDEHPDAIQFFTANKVKANTDITIQNNVIMQGAGRGSQGIFMGEETGGKLPYKNVNIKNNMVYVTGWYQGIMVANGSNVNVVSNTVVSKVDTQDFWIQLNNINGGTVADNVTDSLVLNGTSNLTMGKNAILKQDSATLRQVVGINAVNSARLADLIVPGMGYHPPAGSAAAALVNSQILAAKPANPSLVLDLSFNANGVVDQSRWNSVQTAIAPNPDLIQGDRFQLRTGGGMELNRGFSRQIYGMSAFTLSFDLQRDAPTSPAGQIIGIFRSWGLVLRADGELAFSMTNAAGQNFAFNTKGAKLIDAANHKIAVTYDSARSQAIIYVDGVEKGVGVISGTTRPPESWGLYLGSPFGGGTASAKIGDIEIRDVALSGAQVQTLGLPQQNAGSDAGKYGLTKGIVSTATQVLANAGNQTLAPAATLATMTTVTTATAQVSQLQQVLANKTLLGEGTVSAGLGGSTFAQRLSFDLYHV
ncbi:LamG-like jellyroll fold domain-containing protein [Sphingomonas sp. TDK1]|uniref:LamG-like jellyroll fold domain-containing protein n=1 Tax=Sphingomonas sp. TDK1 TaxID=453247 RepID=UPI0007DA1C79|nr:LamG-like jellyroll fold domain-containing protein [Sphingomonas sp. TDK1]OAN66842.1 hypothetical protein A7X12_09470 [Sphingomonas sp. TDK1]